MKHTPRPITLPPVVINALQEAIHMAAKRDGAPHRCTRRACRRSHSCHAKLDHHADHDCEGHLSARAEETAVDMLALIVRLSGEGKAA